jgi:pyrroline-5-carboxylate reductase
MSIRFGIIGGGVMGEALLSRLLAQKVYSPNEVIVSDRLPQRRAFLSEKYGIETTDDNRATASATEVLLLAIKPQVWDRVATDLTAREEVPEQQLVISILAGVRFSQLEWAFPGQPIVRAMPNTPATVGMGMTAIAPGSLADERHLDRAEAIFQAVGEVVEVPESMMDAVTGLSGSGPAFVAMTIEALADGGVAAGLPRAIATKLAVQTVLGTAQLLQASGMHPAELKDRVASPGGTTIAGIVKLEKAGFRSAAIEAVMAACQRSKELGS